MNALVPTNSVTRPLSRTSRDNNSDDLSSIRAVTIILGLLARFIGVLLLLGLFAITGVIWIWLASFRSGWRLGEWLSDDENQNQDKLALNILHNSIVALFSPLAVAGDWLENLMREKFQLQFPPQIDLRQIVETQLGIKLSENSPCLPKPDALEDSIGSGKSK
jgi:hypothetical protein